MFELRGDGDTGRQLVMGLAHIGAVMRREGESARGTERP